MADEHEGPGHGNVTLSLTTATPDGGRLFRSWIICECSALVQRLGELLPEPAWETLSTAEAVRAGAEAARNIPGSIHTGEGL